MYIKNLKIINFRNYDEAQIKFSPNINILYGDNAQGKTNILESIFYSSLGKSFRTNREKEMIQKDKKYMKVFLEFASKSRDEKIETLYINEYMKKPQKKVLINGVGIKRMSDLIGKINVVIFTPETIEILKGGPSERRKFLNMLISQVRPRYLTILNNYRKILDQRNEYLKSNEIDKNMISIWNEELAKTGYEIYKYRNEFIEKIKEKIVKIHSEITEESIEIKYDSQCKNINEFIKKLNENFEKDRQRGYTSSRSSKR